MSRLALSKALSRVIGQTMTLELAQQVVREALPDEDRSIDPARFGCEAWSGYTLRAERVAGNAAALAPLHAAYHESVRGMAFDLNFDFARLIADERAGTVAMFTARTAAGDLIGIMRVRVGRTLESQHLQACDDMFFIAPAHRSLGLAVRLWKFAERSMFGAGVREVVFDSLGITDAGRMARYLGYTKVAEKFHKVAHDACDYSQVPTRHHQGVAHVPLAPH